MEKRITWKSGSLLFAGILLSGCAPVLVQQDTARPVPALNLRPTLTVAPEVVEYRRKVKLLIAGSGFQPKQELSVMIEMGGAPSDISYLARPPAITNEYGAFASVWEIDGEIQQKLLQPTIYTLEAVDAEGRTLASAPVIFCDSKAAKKVPACEFFKIVEDKKR